MTASLGQAQAHGAQLALCSPVLGGAVQPDGTVILHVGGDEPADVVDRNRLDVGRQAFGRPAPGRGKMELAEGQHRAVDGIILRAGQVLQHHLPGGLEFLVGQPRPTKDVGIQRQCIGEPPRHHRPRNAGMRRRDRLGPLDTVALERLDDLPARAVARPAQAHFAGQRGEATPADGVVNRAGGRMKRDRHRLQLRQVLTEQRDAVGERRGEECLLQDTVSAGCQVRAAAVRPATTPMHGVPTSAIRDSEA